MYIIREANSLEDFDAFLALKSQKDAVKWSGFESAPEANSFKKYFVDKVLNNPMTHVFFLCDQSVEGCPIVGYRQYDQLSDLEVEVRGTTILKKYQGTDAISALDALMADHFKDKGYKFLSTWISEKNKASEYNTLMCGWEKTSECEKRDIPLLGGEHVFYKWIKVTE